MMALFPPWIDRARPLAGILLVLAPAYVLGMLYYAGSPETLDTGYSPEQPVPFSHALHAGEMGIDCRYCHTTVEAAAHAAVPSTSICMNCHKQIATDSEKLLPVRQSYATKRPIPWVRVHDLPDFVYFDHSAHVTRGIGCSSCHGRVDKMEQVTQVETLRMGWCLRCHRHPEQHLRPREFITTMDEREWLMSETQEQLGLRLRDEYNIDPSTDCSTCHR
jgi:hypothetical protein